MASLAPPARHDRWRLDAVGRVFRWVPPFTAGRTLGMALGAAGVQLGASCMFWGMPTLVGEQDLCKKLKIGNYCGFNVDCYFELYDQITIGDHVAVGHEVMFLTRTRDRSQAARRAGRAGSAPIEVGNGAWLGARATILPGVKIGAGSVVGASVVVTKDVPPNMLLIGNRTISLAKWR